MNFDIGQLPDLRAALWNLLKQVPLGRVTTYGQLAEALGDRVAARWLGEVLLHHEHRQDCLCHRVVRANGELGLFVEGSPEAKAQRLRSEGVMVHQNKVELDHCGFESFCSHRPLETLRQIQDSLASQVFMSAIDPPQSLGGVDVSYADQQTAVAAYVQFDANSGPSSPAVPCFHHLVFRRVDFPYISTFLAFRELPILLDLLHEVQQQRPLADVILVDGSGVLHPRRAGIATMLGVALKHSTIGVTKKKLAGKVKLDALRAGEWSEISLDGERLGTAIHPRTGSARPFYVSPGHRLGVESSRRIVMDSLGPQRLPLPIYWADRLSRRAARQEKTAGQDGADSRYENAEC